MATIILFHNPKSIFSKIIEFFENSPISHSGIGMNYNGIPYVLHAAWGGVAFVPRSEILSNHTIVAEFEILPNIDDEIALAKKKIGEPYSVLTLFGYIPVLFAEWFHIGFHNPFYFRSSVVCSEFIVEVDVYDKIHEFDEVYPADITPKKLFDICNSGSSFHRII